MAHTIFILEKDLFPPVARSGPVSLIECQEALAKMIPILERAIQLELAARHLMDRYREDYCDVDADHRPLFDLLDARVPA